jgi:hypothetical protein
MRSESGKFSGNVERELRRELLENHERKRVECAARETISSAEKLHRRRHRQQRSRKIEVPFIYLSLSLYTTYLSRWARSLNKDLDL